MITRRTKLKNLYKNTSLEQYKEYFYYGFMGNGFGEFRLDKMGDQFPYKDMIKSMNNFLNYYNDKKLEFIFLNKDKPDVNIMFLKQEFKSKVAVFLAGGGFTSVASSIEALPIAEFFYKNGFSVAILTYSIFEKAKLNSTNDDLMSAIRYLKNNEESLNIDMTDFILGGCSAGGYVSARYGTSNAGYKVHNLPKPGLLVLCYPVLSMKDSLTNESSKKYLLGDNPTENLIKEFSIEENISKDYPPTFIWHCLGDKAVPCKSTELFVQELKKNNVTCELMLFNSDIHGWGIATNTIASCWPKKMLKFYKKVTKKE